MAEKLKKYPEKRYASNTIHKQDVLFWVFLLLSDLYEIYRLTLTKRIFKKKTFSSFNLKL